MPVLRIFLTGVLKVAHLLLLLLVSVFGAPNAGIVKALDSLRNAFRAGLQRAAASRLIVPQQTPASAETSYRGDRSRND